MPISKDEWAAGRTWETFEGQILSFLTKNRARAFTTVEIMNNLGYVAEIKDLGSLFGGLLTLWSAQRALNTLIKEGSVKAKRVKHTTGEDTFYKAT